MPTQETLQSPEKLRIYMDVVRHLGTKAIKVIAFDELHAAMLTQLHNTLANEGVAALPEHYNSNGDIVVLTVLVKTYENNPRREP